MKNIVRDVRLSIPGEKKDQSSSSTMAQFAGRRLTIEVTAVVGKPDCVWLGLEDFLTKVQVYLSVDQAKALKNVLNESLKEDNADGN